MKEFFIEITEILQKTISIISENEEDALRIAKENYDSEKIILNEASLVEVNFDIKK